MESVEIIDLSWKEEIFRKDEGDDRHPLNHRKKNMNKVSRRLIETSHKHWAEVVRLTSPALEKKTCTQCRYVTYLNPYVCETLNLARNPFSLWLRLRLGYGAYLRKKKLVRHRASMCSEYEERE